MKSGFITAQVGGISGFKIYKFPVITIRYISLTNLCAWQENTGFDKLDFHVIISIYHNHEIRKINHHI